MIIIKKMFLFIKNIFVKQEEVKKIEEPKILENQDKKKNFIESLRIDPIERRKNKKVETLVCDGDGLGIQNKLSY